MVHGTLLKVHCGALYTAQGTLWCTVHCLRYFVVHCTMLKVHCGARYTALEEPCIDHWHNLTIQARSCAP